MKRKLRPTPQRRSVREQELIAEYEKKLAAERKRYKKLESYNNRLYAQYTGLHEEYMHRLRNSTGVKEDSLIDDGALPPFHPLK